MKIKPNKCLQLTVKSVTFFADAKTAPLFTSAEAGVIPLYMMDTSFSNQEIAECQLMRALKLFFDEKDYVSVITLAGASEEILGRLVEANGKQSAYASRKKAFDQVYGHFYEEPPDKTEFNEMVNGVRNGLKHFTAGKPLCFDPEQEAINILDSAVTNYLHLTGVESEEIAKFRNYHERLHLKF